MFSLLVKSDIFLLNASLAMTILILTSSDKAFLLLSNLKLSITYQCMASITVFQIA